MSAAGAPGLEAAPAVATAREALAGRRAWVVGGALRDALSGRPVVDVDLAVPAGEERESAQAIARAVGGSAFPLSTEFGTWRAVAPRQAWHVDVTRLRAPSIEADLAQRDFTINAMALPLHEPEAGPIDPYGGLRDLADGLLRAVSERSFSDDPLQLLRAARLASAYGLRIEPDTLAQARACAGRAAEPAGERQLAELRALLAGADPARGIELLGELGALREVLPEVEGLRGVEQNPNHHLDVLGHTLEVVRRTVEVEQQLDRFAGEAAEEVGRLLAEPLGDEFTRSTALRLGALLHGVGKQATKGERSGYVTFIGHDAVGAEMSRGILRRLKASRALSRHVEGLVRHHLHLGFLVHERPLSRRRVYEYLDRCGDVAADVTLLTAADRLSARGSGAVASPQMIEAHLELVREMLPAALAWHREGPPALPVRGDELAEALGIERGPRLGELLDRLRAEAYVRGLRTREEAIAAARRLLAEGPAGD